MCCASMWRHIRNSYLHGRWDYWGNTHSDEKSRNANSFYFSFMTSIFQSIQSDNHMHEEMFCERIWSANDEEHILRVLTLDLFSDSPLLLLKAASWNWAQLSNKLFELHSIKQHNKMLKYANQLCFHFSQFFQVSEMKIAT